MRIPRLTAIEKLVFAACYAQECARLPAAVDNSQADEALEAALWAVECFRQALRERKP